MKLNEKFKIVTREDGSAVIVSCDPENFNGVVRLNGTAGYICSCLQSEITAEEIIGKLLEIYDVDRDTAAKDVNKVVGTLRQIGAIDETGG